MAARTIQVTIKAPTFTIIELEIVGTAPYVQHRFSEKAKQQMIATQEAGSRSSSKSGRQPKDFEQVFRDATHRTSAGWAGIPTTQIRNGMISACKVAGYVMTRAKLAIFVEPDGYDAADGTPLVRIIGTPVKNIMPARNDNGSVDMRCRPMWAQGWSARVRIRFDADMMDASDITNLMKRLGLQVGIGEGRPDSKESCGLMWGLFEVRTAKKTRKGLKEAASA